MGLQIGVQLTTRCNMNCSHCYVTRDGRDLSVETFERLVAFAAANPGTHIDLTGGEPTCHPAFGSCLNILNRAGLTTRMVTNGWTFAEMVLDLGPALKALDFVAFSLDGATPAVHDGARRPGAFSRVMQAASVCRAIGMLFGLRTTLTAATAADLPALALLAATLGAAELTVSPLQPTPDTADRGLLLSPAQLEQIPAAVAHLRSVFTMPIRLTTGFFDDDPDVLCPPLTGDHLFVKADGTVGFCCQLADHIGTTDADDVIGDLAAMSIEEAHRRMTDAVVAFRAEKRRLAADGALTRLDRCACWYCLKRFGKMNWLRDHAESAWGRDVAGVTDAGRPAPCRPHPDVLETPIDDDRTALVHGTTGRTYTLNGTGIHTWAGLRAGRSAAEIAAGLAERFDVAIDRARADVDRFVRDLLALGLVVPDDGPPRNRAGA